MAIATADAAKSKSPGRRRRRGRLSSPLRSPRARKLDVKHNDNDSSDSRDMTPNVTNVVLGDLLIKTWYPSFYPEELIGRDTVERLFVCRWCFKYSRELIPFVQHIEICPLRNASPPGKLIYAGSSFSIYEVDGEEEKMFTQNLSLFAKLFLDNKSVFYDVSTFLYYVLVSHEDSSQKSEPESKEDYKQQQVVGFFSKEKLSWDHNNLACILVFPPWQRKGLGQILMAASYELSKRDGRIGGPEKPLSSLGLRGYQAFWAATLARCILAKPESPTTLSETPLTVKDLTQETYILQDDIVSTLQLMQVVDRRNASPRVSGGNSSSSTINQDDGKLKQVYVNKTRLREWAQANCVSITNPIDPTCFVNNEDVSVNGTVNLPNGHRKG